MDLCSVSKYQSVFCIQSIASSNLLSIYLSLFLSLFFPHSSFVSIHSSRFSCGDSSCSSSRCFPTSHIRFSPPEASVSLPSCTIGTDYPSFSSISWYASRLFGGTRPSERGSERAKHESTVSPGETFISTSQRFFQLSIGYWHSAGRRLALHNRNTHTQRWDPPSLWWAEEPGSMSCLMDLHLEEEWVDVNSDVSRGACSALEFAKSVLEEPTLG